MERLEQTAIPMSEIAAALGYEDAASFTRALRRWTGSAPSEMRRRLAGWHAVGERTGEDTLR